MKQGKIKWEHPYLGYDISRHINPKEVVDDLLENKIVGVANGRAEFGPRALGNRSLLGDPRYDIKDTVNTIKKRQKFRPFAPAILEEFADKYFEGPMNRYMQFVANRRLENLDMAYRYDSDTNPFPWLSEIIDIRKQKNFFETRVIDYQDESALVDDF